MYDVCKKVKKILSIIVTRWHKLYEARDTFELLVQLLGQIFNDELQR